MLIRKSNKPIAEIFQPIRRSGVARFAGSRTAGAAFDEHRREHFLNAVSSVLDVHTRVSDLYSSPQDQVKEQLRLTIETINEADHWYGIVGAVARFNGIVKPALMTPQPSTLQATAR